MFLELFIAIVLAAVLAGVLIGLMHRRAPGPSAGFFYVFLLLFLFIWVGGGWLIPVGVPLWGVHWLSLLAVGVCLFLLLAAVMPSSHPPRTKDPEHEGETPNEPKVNASVALTFWLLIALLALAAGVRFHWGEPFQGVDNEQISIEK